LWWADRLQLQSGSLIGNETLRSPCVFRGFCVNRDDSLDRRAAKRADLGHSRTGEPERGRKDGPRSPESPAALINKRRIAPGASDSCRLPWTCLPISGEIRRDRGVDEGTPILAPACWRKSGRSDLILKILAPYVFGNGLLGVDLPKIRDGFCLARMAELLDALEVDRTRLRAVGVVVTVGQRQGSTAALGAGSAGYGLRTGLCK